MGKYHSLLRLGVRLFFILVLIVQVGCKEEAPYHNITPLQLKSMLDEDETLMLIDVRTRPEYEEGHIVGVKKLIPLDKLESRIGELEEFKNKKIVLYCRSGSRSSRAAKILLSHGFKKIYNLQGGIIAYKESGFKIESTH
ncbi:MAG: rhodanese-like domain-containing protein [Candidatus Schekmanbacteria bacterium]|nr:MAG: rhodanese-like domain-containing protein [Candidatus Schekmanbacteria bacterium]